MFINSSYVIPQLLHINFSGTPKLGCEDCYEIFSNRIDPILKNIHGGNRHIGRGILQNRNRRIENISKPVQTKNVETKSEDNKLDELKNDLKKAIKEERYEDAAKLRDEIKKLEK